MKKLCVSFLIISAFVFTGCSNTRVKTPGFEYTRWQTGTKVQLKRADHTTTRTTNDVGQVTVTESWQLEGVLSDAVEGFKAGLDAGIKLAEKAKP